MATIYDRMLFNAQDKLDASINQIRSSIPHAGEIGTLIEQQFRSQLDAVLPEKIGVSHGFVVDSLGSVSRQMDVILYDKANTPRIFASDGAQIFPVETTYACGEIKTKLDSSALEDSFEKCLSYKKLRREAYIQTPNPIVQYTLFGCKCDHWQSIFFCIAVESIDAADLNTTYDEIVERGGLPVHKRIDTIMALEGTNCRNFLLNVSGEVRNDVPSDKSIDFLPNSDSKLCSYPAKKPWALFVMLLLRYMTEAPTERINMLAYSTGPY
jgi:hypothetical protein